MIGDDDDGDGDDQVEVSMPGIIFSVPAHFYPLPPSPRAQSTTPHYMIIHLHPPTCSSPLDLVLEGCRFEPFFGSTTSALLYVASSSFAFLVLSHVVVTEMERGKRDRSLGK